MLRVGIVGCGLISARKYIPIFQRLKSRANVVGLCDVNESLLRDVAGRFGIAGTYVDLSKMLADARPDVVAVCTPPKTHMDLVVKALEGGAHVLVEKPMALTSGECAKMVEAARASGRRLGVMHNQAFNPAFEQACQMVSAGAIGAFQGMRIFLMTPADDMTTNPKHWAHRLPGGVVGETGPHAVYLSLGLLHKVRDVQVCTKKLLPEYTWSVAEDVRFDLLADNGISSVALMYGSNQSAAEIEIVGTTGMLKVDLQSRILVNHQRTVAGELLNPRAVTKSVLASLSQTASGLFRNGVRYAMTKSLDGHYIGIQRFVDHVANGSSYPADGERAKETVEVLERVVAKLDHALAASKS
jgi:predicted dehydrogenase